MNKISIAAQLINIKKQQGILLKREKELKLKFRALVLGKIIELIKSSGLSINEISTSLNNFKTKKTPKTKNRSKTNPTKGLKLPAKYRNPQDYHQTWTGRGIAPDWVAKLKESGNLEAALVVSQDNGLVNS